MGFSDHNSHFFLAAPPVAHIRITPRARDFIAFVVPSRKIPLHHLLRLIPQRRLLHREQPKPLHRRAPHHIALIPSQQRHRPSRPQPLHPRMRHPRHHQPQMPPRPRLFHRQRLQQSSQLIRISLERPDVHLCNSSGHIRRPLPYLDVLAKELPHQRPNPSLVPGNLLSDRTRTSQPPRSSPQPPPQRLHAAKYISVFPHQTIHHPNGIGPHLTPALPKKAAASKKSPLQLGSVALGNTKVQAQVISFEDFAHILTGWGGTKPARKLLPGNS